MTDTATAAPDLIAYCRQVAALVRPLGYTLRQYRSEIDGEVHEGAAAYRAAMQFGDTPRQVADDLAFYVDGFAGLGRLAAVVGAR